MQKLGLHNTADIVLYAVRRNSKINQEASKHNQNVIESPPGT